MQEEKNGAPDITSNYHYLSCIIKHDAITLPLSTPGGRSNASVDFPEGLC